MFLPNQDAITKLGINKRFHRLCSLKITHRDNLETAKTFDWLCCVSYQMQSSEYFADFKVLQLRGPFFIVSLLIFTVNLSSVVTKSL